MKRDLLSPGQWGALLWVAAMAPAAELLPGTALETAGRGGWLSPGAAGIILLPLLGISRREGDALSRQTGWRKLLLRLCTLWMGLLLIFRLVLCARRMLWVGERDGAGWYFLLTLSALTLWMGQGKLRVLGRTGQMFLVLLLAAAALVLGLSVIRVRADRLFPLWSEDVVPVLRSSAATAGHLSWALLPMLFLPAREGGRKRVVLWGAGGCMLLILAQAIILGNLGVGLAARSESAFFALTKRVGVEGAFQRVESVVSALWVLSDLTVCAVLVHAIGLVWEGSLFHVKRERVSSVVLLVGTGAALWILRQGIPIEEWNRDWVWLGNLMACVLAVIADAKGVAMVKKPKSG